MSKPNRKPASAAVMDHSQTMFLRAIGVPSLLPRSCFRRPGPVGGVADPPQESYIIRRRVVGTPLGATDRAPVTGPLALRPARCAGRSAVRPILRGISSKRSPNMNRRSFAQRVAMSLPALAVLSSTSARSPSAAGRPAGGPAGRAAARTRPDGRQPGRRPAAGPEVARARSLAAAAAQGRARTAAPHARRAVRRDRAVRRQGPVEVDRRRTRRCHRTSVEGGERLRGAGAGQAAA